MTSQIEWDHQASPPTTHNKWQLKTHVELFEDGLVAAGADAARVVPGILDARVLDDQDGVSFDLFVPEN